MNGIHDVGGMEGLGELGYEPQEPMFHSEWEGRMHALAIPFLQLGLRSQIEKIPAADYLTMSYYERWLTAISQALIDNELVTSEEIESGKPAPGSTRATPSLGVEEARALPFRTSQSQQATDVAARYEVGDRVRGRNINPPGHTRMPRYTRGRAGVIERNRGVFVLPDSDDYGDPRPQHVYLIRFTARELWGERAAAQDSLYIDMWESYLEPA